MELTNIRFLFAKSLITYRKSQLLVTIAYSIFKCRSCSKDSKCTERKNFMPRNMQCPFCDCGMVYNKRDSFLSCTYCGTEIFPFINDQTVEQVVREEFEKNLPCARNTDVSSVMMATKGPKSSSKSKGASKKGLMQKKSTTQIYKDLAN